MVSWVYPIVAHSLWSQNGFLSPTLINPLLGVGCVDFAGSGVIHLTGGLSAFIAVYVLGPRRGRFYNSQGEPLAQPKEIPGHSISLQVLGFFILWFGCKFVNRNAWIPFATSISLKLPLSAQGSA